MPKGDRKPGGPALGADKPGRPYLVDNRDGNSLDKALLKHLHALRGEQSLLWEICLASAFFNVQGFELIAPELEGVGHVRLLLGASPRPEELVPPRKPGDPPEPEYTRRRVGAALHEQDDGLRRHRDLLPFDREHDRAVRRLLHYLRSGKVEVRRYEGHFLHAKAYIFRVAGGGAVVGSSNLTYGGLRSNLELNLGQYDDVLVRKIEEWFDALWGEARPFDLAAIYERLLAEYPPYLIYLKVLYHLYGAEIEEEEQPGSGIELAEFQRHGVWRALRILKKCGGVLVADGVGLGKTYISGEIILQYRERRQRVLLICPAALRDSTWKQFIAQHEIFLDCLSYEELARDRRLGGDHDHLRYPTDDYALVVIDEAHNYRNPDAPTRAAVLRRLLMGPRRDLVLLTATPVNNSLWDLYHILRYFMKQDAFLADRGVLSIRDRFDLAMKVDPFNLNPDMLYPIIDATTVKRTRKFIKKHYADNQIRLPDGRMELVHFPKPIPLSVNYDLEDALPGFVAELETALMPPLGRPLLTMARYKPENYPAGAPPSGSDPAIVGLVRSGLLKRFESSAHAFARTAERMIRENEGFLRGLDRGVVARKDVLHELAASDDEEVIEELLRSDPRVEPADQFNVPALRADVESDTVHLRRLWARADKVGVVEDPKLKVLVEELVRIAQQARDEAIDPEDERRKRKVMVFSAYEETIDWVEGFLDRHLDKDPRLACYRGRMASVSGEDSRKNVSREEAVCGFAPESAGALPGKADDRFDLLLSTDVLAEGMNLQQCRNVINFDLPWNPMRLVQRHGRIDRIGSKHPQVYLRTYFPDRQLDALLQLEGRVRSKLAQAAASIGVESPPIEHGSMGLQSFAETREEIEKLKRGDPSLYEAGGTASAAQSGEEYRQELRKALEVRREEILGLPWKAGSGMVKGSRRGHFFCAAVGDRVYLRFVPLLGSESDLAIVSEIGTCLRMIECIETTSRVVPSDLLDSAFSAWEQARHDIFNGWTYETDPANLQPKVSKLNRAIAEHVRGYPPTDVPQKEIEKALDAIEAPCSRREENALRAVFEREFRSHDAKSKAILEEVRRLGLEPFQAPQALDPIQPEDIHLICWMAIERESPR